MRKSYSLYSNKAQNSQRGITLIEILILVSLITIVASFGLFISMDSYTNSSFRNERNMFLASLMHARAQAVNNTCMSTSVVICAGGKAHGVHIESVGGSIKEYVIFQGTTYNPTDPTNETIKTNHYVTQTGPADIYFSQLSGSVVTPVTITLSDGGSDSSDIIIGSEGQIYWTH